MKEGTPEENGNMFNWEGFENKFFKEGAWKQALNAVPGGNLSFLEDYVQQLLTDLVPNSAAGSAGRSARTSGNSALTFNVFETHEFVIVRIRASQPVAQGLVRIYAGVRELVVRGLPKEAEKRIALPANIRLEGGKAVYKEGVFEVRLPKEKGEVFKELPIRYP